MTNLYTDEELVQLYVQTRNNQYFNQLYVRHHRGLYAQCRQYFKDDPEAEDIVHDIFIRLLNRIDSFQGTAQFSTWLYSMTQNYCVDIFRRKRRLEVRASDYFQHQINQPLWEESNSTEGQSLRLTRALANLSDEERFLLVTKYEQEVSLIDLAITKCTTLGAVKMRLKRARARLRTEYLKTA